MRPRPPSRGELERIIAILAFQFSWRVAEEFERLSDRITVSLSGRGRIKYVHLDGRHALTLRPTTGLFTISKVAGEVIRRAEPPPRFRVIISGERDIKGSVLAVDVVAFDPDIRPGDEVIIVDKNDNLVAVGRSRVSARLMESLEYGEVVRVR
jgi:archaeosine-15-forming tRNA-guanine transglycosylase